MLDPLQFYCRVLCNGMKMRFRMVMIAHPGPGIGFHKRFMWQIIIPPTPYQSYFGKAPSLATLCLFGCKAYAHIPKVDQTKLGECSIECVHIGFAEEKRAYILYSHEQRHLIESRDVEFEEVENEGWERITPDLDTSDEDPDMDTNIDHDSTLEDSGGGQKSTLNPQGNDLPAPELSSPSLTIPTSIPPHRSNCPNKGIPPP